MQPARGDCDDSSPRAAQICLPPSLDAKQQREGAQKLQEDA